MTEHSAVTQRVGFTGARLRISRLRPDGGLQRTLERICEISAHALGVARVGVWVAEVDQDRLRCVAQFAEGVDRPPLGTLSISEHPHYCAAVLNNRFVAATDVATDARTRELSADYLAPLGITSMLDAALYRDGRVIGVVCHEAIGTQREWDTDERQFAATVADLTAYFMESHARTEAERTAHALQVSMLERDRLELIGRFATGVAHDLNNLIAAAQLNLKLLERHAADRESVGELSTALEHAQALARQLMAFQKGSEVPSLVSGDALKTRLEPLLGAFLKPTSGPMVTVRYAFAEGVTFFAIPEQLAQVVINLVTNARDAMKDGGVVLLRARPSEEEPGFTQLDVIDTGTGIASDHVTQLFQPFFSTKGSAGTGLGLSLVHFIVGQHHGTVAIHSTPGDGTTVSIRWPADAAHAT
jgi:two-component system, cell cycle sensor histidine kinase and response regulator CckA